MNLPPEYPTKAHAARHRAHYSSLGQGLLTLTGDVIPPSFLRDVYRAAATWARIESPELAGPPEEPYGFALVEGK